jgi:hypothetical protein
VFLRARRKVASHELHRYLDNILRFNGSEEAARTRALLDAYDIDLEIRETSAPAVSLGGKRNRISGTLRRRGLFHVRSSAADSRYPNIGARCRRVPGRLSN